MEPSRQLSMGAISIFKEGILLTLSRWWALQMAVVNEWGGWNSAFIEEQLGEDILSWFIQSKDDHNRKAAIEYDLIVVWVFAIVEDTRLVFFTSDDELDKCISNLVVQITSRNYNKVYPLDLDKYTRTLYALARKQRIREPLYIDDLEHILENGLMSLNTMEEDGSIEEVAEKLMILHEECLEGNFMSIQKLKEASAQEVGHSHIKKVVYDEDDDRSNTDEPMDMAVDGSENRSNQTPGVDVPKPNQMVDADGWAVVGSRKNKGRKK